MEKSSSDYGLLRLKSKDARSAIVQKRANDFILTPIIAEAFYQQFHPGVDYPTVPAFRASHPKIHRSATG